MTHVLHARGEEGGGGGGEGVARKHHVSKGKFVKAYQLFTPPFCSKKRFAASTDINIWLLF